MYNPNLEPEKQSSEQILDKFLGQESCRTKVVRIFRIFVPNFAPNFAPNFPRIFQGLFVPRFVGDGDQKKFTKNPRHFSMQNSQANTKRIFTKFFWRAGKVTNLGVRGLFECCKGREHSQLLKLLRNLQRLFSCGGYSIVTSRNASKIRENGHFLFLF